MSSEAGQEKGSNYPATMWLVMAVIGVVLTPVIDAAVFLVVIGVVGLLWKLVKRLG